METRRIILALIAIFLITAAFILLVREAGTSKASSYPPNIYTEGNKILSSKDKQPITLRGAVSDYFRYDFNYDYPRLRGGLDHELKNVSKINGVGNGINVIGLYLARLDKIKENVAEMDQYIQYAGNNGLYVYLAPAGTGFIETNPDKNAKMDAAYWESVGPDDLAELTEFLSSRYRHYPHVMYQLTAEPNISPRAWETKQQELAGVVRRYTDNPIIVSTPYYSPYSNLPVLPYVNIIYSTGGYIRKDDSSFRERDTAEILGDEKLRRDYPVLVAEFGGNYGDDFSTPQDLGLFKDILANLHREGMSYTVYRLSAAFEDDGLALFNTLGELSAKGEVFAEFLRSGN